MRLPARLSFLLLLAAGACAAPRGPAPPPAALAAPAPAPAASPDLVGQDATRLQTLIGAPVLDTREGPARRLQFRGPACVLDAYLYPPADGTGPATVRWTDARSLIGGDFDRASCIAALSRR